MTAYKSPGRILSSATQITVASGGLPAWAPGPGQYALASTGTIQTDVSPFYPASTTNPVFGGTQGQVAMLCTWNGGAYAPTMGTLGSMYFWGGGHYGYYGDDVIRYDLATRLFSRVWGPSPYATTISNGSNPPDDTGHVRGTINGEWVTGVAAGHTIPVPYHTYNGVNWVPQACIPGSSPLGSLVFSMSQATGLTVAPPNTWSFDLSAAANDWDAWTRWMSLTNPSAQGGNYGLHHGSVYDSKRNVIWTGGADTVRPLWRNDLNAGVCTYAGSPIGNYTGSSVSEACFVYMPALDCLISHSQGTSAPRYWGIDLSTSPAATSSLSGITRHELLIANPSVGPGYSLGNLTGGGSWHMEVIDGKIAFLYATPTNVYIYLLEPPAAPTSWKTGQWTWTIATLSPKTAGDNTQMPPPTSPVHYGAYSKIRYIPALKAMFYLYSTARQAVLARHPNWT